MSFVTTQPEMLSAAAADLQSIGTTVSAANAGASGTTTDLAPAAADQVSGRTAALFGVHAQSYQTISAQATAVHEQFIATLKTSALSYAATEAANAAATG
jgi:hypothetical protein